MEPTIRLKKSIETFLTEKVTTFGFAPVTRFENAPEAHHPERLCKNAETVIVFGISIPRGILRSPDYDLHTMQRSYHTVYTRLDDIALDLCNVIETSGHAYAVPVPAYAPMAFQGVEKNRLPRGAGGVATIGG